MRNTLSMVALMAVMSVHSVTAAPAVASGIPVFDGSNFSQSVVTAMNMINSVTNQATQIRNEVEQIQNQLRTLQTLPAGQFDVINGSLSAQTNRLNEIIGAMDGIGYDAGSIKHSFDALFPKGTQWEHIDHDTYGEYFRNWSAELQESTHNAMQMQGSLRDMEQQNREAQRILMMVDGADGQVRQLQGVNAMLGILTSQMHDVSQNLASSGRVSAVAVAKAQAQEDARRALREEYYRHTHIPTDNGERF